MKDKTIIGLIETITIFGKKENIEIKARIDTGATKSSINQKLSERLDLGPIIGTKIVKSAHGTSTRPLVEATIKISNKEVKGEFSIANRNHMKYEVLIGQNILKQGFLIDPEK